MLQFAKDVGGISDSKQLTTVLSTTTLCYGLCRSLFVVGVVAIANVIMSFSFVLCATHVCVCVCVSGASRTAVTRSSKLWNIFSRISFVYFNCTLWMGAVLYLSNSFLKETKVLSSGSEQKTWRTDEWDGDTQIDHACNFDMTRTLTWHFATTSPRASKWRFLERNKLKSIYNVFGYELWPECASHGNY